MAKFALYDAGLQLPRAQYHRHALCSVCCPPVADLDKKLPRSFYCCIITDYDFSAPFAAVRNESKIRNSCLPA